MHPEDLKTKRENLGLTQKALAEALNLSTQQISNYESGRALIPKTVALSVEYLLLEKGRSSQNLEGLTQREQDALSQFAETLHESLGHNLIILLAFGSKVRGEGSPDSDLDLLLILKRVDSEIRQEVFDSLFDIDPEGQYKISPVLLSLSDYQKNETLRSPFISNIKREGVLL